ncbi:hypothetical protein [Nonomuraea dietziae]
MMLVLLNFTTAEDVDALIGHLRDVRVLLTQTFPDDHFEWMPDQS